MCWRAVDVERLMEEDREPQRRRWASGDRAFVLDVTIAERFLAALGMTAFSVVAATPKLRTFS